MTELPTAVALNHTDCGDGVPIVILHGLFGRLRNWQGMQKQLARAARIVTADLRNHGESPWSDEMSYPAMAADIAKLIGDLNIAPAVIVGHSMGGKAAMCLALSQPELVQSLMVVDIAPVDYQNDYGPYIDAMRAVPLTELSRRGEAEEYLKADIPETGIRAFIMQNLGETEGGLAWQANINAIENGMPNIMTFPNFAGATYDGPTRFVIGGTSDYVKAEHRHQIMSLFPNASHAVIKGAGHWVHAQKPAEVMAEISTFADQTT